MALDDSCDFQIVGTDSVFARSKLLESLPGVPIHGEDMNLRHELHSLLQSRISPKDLGPLSWRGESHCTSPSGSLRQ
jgi:hypothetical protein